ncbi:MAG: ABC transporter substrate-binding protein [Candidatus Binatia bacterium]
MIDVIFSGTGPLRSLALVAAAAIFAVVAPASVSGATGETTLPGRIVSLVPAITETLFAIGAGPRVVGVSTYCDYPEAAGPLPKVGTFTEPVAEVIVALRPDLVLTSPSPGNETSVRAIERTGVRVAVVQSEGGLKEARSAILEVARQVGAGPAGEALMAGIDARLEAVRRASAPLDRVKTAVVVGREPLVLAGPASYLGELLQLAGGVNIAGEMGGRWPRVGMEFLVQAAPEVLVDLSASMGETPAGGGTPVSNWSALQSVPAVANGRVVADRASVMLRPGPRLAEAAEALFVALHPGVAIPRSPSLATPAPAPALPARSAATTGEGAR